MVFTRAQQNLTLLEKLNFSKCNQSLAYIPKKTNFY